PRGPGRHGLRRRSGAVRGRRFRWLPASTTSGSDACIYASGLFASTYCLLASSSDSALHLSAARAVTAAGGIGQGPVLWLGRTADRLRPGESARGYAAAPAHVLATAAAVSRGRRP